MFGEKIRKLKEIGYTCEENEMIAAVSNEVHFHTSSSFVSSINLVSPVRSSRYLGMLKARRRKGNPSLEYFSKICKNGMK